MGQGWRRLILAVGFATLAYGWGQMRYAVEETRSFTGNYQGGSIAQWSQGVSNVNPIPSKQTFREGIVLMTIGAALIGFGIVPTKGESPAGMNLPTNDSDQGMENQSIDT